MAAFLHIGVPEFILVAMVFAFVIGAPLAVVLLVLFLVRRGRKQPGTDASAPPPTHRDAMR